jgi:hypothetical protein
MIGANHIRAGHACSEAVQRYIDGSVTTKGP